MCIYIFCMVCWSGSEIANEDGLVACNKSIRL